MKVIFFDDDAITTICDRCGAEIAIDEANYAGSELPTGKAQHFATSATLQRYLHYEERHGMNPFTFIKDARLRYLEYLDAGGYEVVVTQKPHEPSGEIAVHDSSLGLCPKKAALERTGASRRIAIWLCSPSPICTACAMA